MTSVLSFLVALLVFFLTLGLVAVFVYALIEIMSKLHVPIDDEEDIKKP